VTSASLPLSILLSYTSYPLSEGDWRGRFMYDLALTLAQRSDVNLSMWGPPGPVPAGADYIATPKESSWLTRLLTQGGIAHLLRTHTVRGLSSGLRLTIMLRRAYRRQQTIDLFHVNWLQNAIALWGSHTPALVTVLGTDYELLSNAALRWALRAVFRQRRCMIAPNAHWMVPALERHFGDIAQVQALPFGIQRRWFEINRTNPDTAPRKWLVVLRLTRNKLGPLFEWGESIFTNVDELHVFGPKQESVTIPHWVHYHGPATPDMLSVQWFPQAAGLITLSRHSEGRPQIMLEAMAAGLPIIASPIPAHMDLLKDGHTGFLVNTQEEFYAALLRLQDPAYNRRIGLTAKNWVKQEIGDWNDCVSRYVAAYRALLTPPQ